MDLATRWNRLRYSLYAPFYDGFVRFPRARARAIQGLELQPHQRVLLVGAGTGLDLAQLPPDVEVLAGDLSPAMVKRMARRGSRLGVTGEYRVMDGQELLLPEGGFDAAVLHLIVAVIPRPRPLLEAVAHAVRPGGRVSIMDKFAPEEGPSSLSRRLLDLPARLLATHLNRRLNPLLEGLPFRVLEREGVALGGFFQRVLLERVG